MSKQVVIRVDGSSQIGLGHLVRCIALAHMLQDHFQIHFISKEVPESIIEDIISSNFRFTKIETEKSFFNLLNGEEIVVLDNYFFDTDYQKRIKEISGCILVCIDDLNDREFYADLIINHNPGLKPQDYQVQHFTQFALGLDYALLRPAFLKAARDERKIEKTESVIICFGGSDPKNLTKNTVQIILDNFNFIIINVVVGVSYLHSDEIEKLALEHEKINLYKGINDSKMLEVMQASDVAIIPSSGILLEALSQKLIIISGVYIENQLDVYTTYKKSGAIIDAGNFSTQNIISALQKLKVNNLTQKEIIDGNSTRRILNLFKNLHTEKELVLRKTESDDVNITFKWAKDPVVRKHSFNRTKISFEEHKNWLVNKLKDPQCKYFIALLENKPIGTVRFDLNGDEAVISYLIDPEFHGRGFGTIILKKGVEFLKSYTADLKEIVGYVSSENIGSIKTFQRLGYIEVLKSEKQSKFVKKLN